MTLRPNQLTVTCVRCEFTTYHVDDQDPCTKCGGPMVVGGVRAARVARERQAKARTGLLVGERDPAEEAATIARLQLARQERAIVNSSTPKPASAPRTVKLQTRRNVSLGAQTFVRLQRYCERSGSAMSKFVQDAVNVALQNIGEPEVSRADALADLRIGRDDGRAEAPPPGHIFTF